MSYTGDPLNRLTDRIRLNVGDTDLDEEGLSDNEYEYIVSLYTVDSVTNEALCVIKALNLLVLEYSKSADEVAGKLSVKFSQIYDHYYQLLDRYTKDPRTALYKAGTPFAGGIYLDDICANKEDPNNVGSTLPIGWTTDDYSEYS